MINDNSIATKEWQKEAIRLGNERLKFIDNLILRLQQEKTTEQKIATCYLLGEYRAYQATANLLQNITIESNINQGDEAGRLPLWGKYPAFEALIKIGIPAIPLVLTKIETESDFLAMRLEVHVIGMVYGKEIAKTILNKAATQQKNVEKTKKIKQAIQLLEYSPYYKLPEKIQKQLDQL